MKINKSEIDENKKYNKIISKRKIINKMPHAKIKA